MGKIRDPYWDSLKFILIVLVVIGHVFEPTCTNGVFNLTMYNWINMFHMPLFIFVSGRFSPMKDRKKYFKGIIRVLETFIVFQLIWKTYLFAIGDNHYLSDWFIPYYSLWYILSLVFWRFFIFIVADRIKENPILWISVSVVIGLLSGFIPIGTLFSFQRTLGFLPFFVAGYCTRMIDVRQEVIKIPVFVAILVLLGSFFLLIPIQEEIKMADVFCCVTPYTTSSMMLARGLFYFSGAIISIAAMRITPSNIHFALWGKQTLFIYIYHTFFIYILFFLINNGKSSDSITWLFIYSAVIVLVLILLSRSKFLNWLLNPVTSLIDRKKKSSDQA